MKIPSLDGLRALSIFLVVAGHLANGYGLPHNAVRTVLGNSALGVNVFFVISGFLITTLLLREYSVTGGISLKQFYFRRAFRILPPYYFYLAAIVLLGATGVLSLPPTALISATLFFWNYWVVPGAWYLEHLWSLAVEEQFYMLWPLLLLSALHHGQHRMATGITLFVILASPFIRLGTFYLAPEPFRSHLYFMFHTWADSLMFGAFCALAINSRNFERVYRFAAKYVLVIALFALIASPLLTRTFGGAYLYVIGFTLEGASIAITMVWLTRNPDTTVGQILNSKMAIQVGVMSYSIYLWQTLFLDPANLSFTGTFPVSILLIALCASFSYYMVERPVLRLRDTLLKCPTESYKAQIRLKEEL